MTDDEGSSKANLPTAATAPAIAGAVTARDSIAELSADGDGLAGSGYELGAIIGRGGMGEVVAAHDRRIGREVAFKRMRGTHVDAMARTRFLREARIQARLDHPAIVPVHELGLDDQGMPFFTMKRLAGVTLDLRIADGTRRARLLRALVEICHALDFAHARRIVHRDIKPANIMLGEYGEVYVLDWGVARVLDAGERHRTDPVGERDLDSLADEATETGALLGTPGYMAPEQVKGARVTAAADVYAVGAILFEILAGEALHPRGTAAIEHTLAQPQALPSARAPEAAIPPELDRLCHDALAEDPAARPTAHEVGDRLQAYLDGDRDLEQRRALAAARLASATTALAAGDRATAIREGGRALALDPDSADAAALVTKLIVEPPDRLPADLIDRLDRSERDSTRERISKAVFAFVSPLVLLVPLPWLHVRRWDWFVALYAGLFTVGVAAYWMARARGRTSLTFLMASILTVVVIWSRLAGPFLLTPTMICGVAFAFSLHPQGRAHPRLLLAYAGLASILPFVLEWTGVIPASTQVVADGLLTTPTIFAVGVAEYVVFVAANTVFVLVVAFYASHVGRVAAAARRALHVQAWHLAQLLPGRAIV